MSLINTFKIAGTGMMAQSTRLNTVASNMANAESVAASEGEVYKARKVVFEAELERNTSGRAKKSVEVKSKEVIQSEDPAKMIYNPAHPLSNDDGYVFMPNVNMAEEMVDMLSASRSYQTNAEVMNTSKTLMLKTLSMGE